MHDLHLVRATDPAQRRLEAQVGSSSMGFDVTLQLNGGNPATVHDTLATLKNELTSIVLSS